MISQYCTKSKFKPIVTLNEKINEDIENERFKPRHHPGIIKPKLISLPEHIVSAISKSIGGNLIKFLHQHQSPPINHFLIYLDTPIKQLIEDGQRLSQYMWSRHAPKEEKEIYRIRKQILSSMLEPMGHKKLSEIGKLL